MGNHKPKILQEMSIACTKDCLFFTEVRDGSAGCYLTRETASPGVPCPVENARSAELRAIEQAYAEEYRKYQERQKEFLDWLYE